MRWSLALSAVVIAVAGCAEAESAAVTDRLNPIIPLLEQGLPVFGVSHPPYYASPRRGRGGGAPATPAAEVPQPDLAEAAREMVGYTLGDFELDTYPTNAADRYRAFMHAVVAEGGSARTHPFLAKIPIIHGNEDRATQQLITQLNDGQMVVAMQEVETVEEIDQAVAAMRFTSKGGVRPEQGFETAAAYWGLTEAEYLDRADVWPLNPAGELLITTIVESREGVANVRAIAASPAVAIVTVGAGTLSGVFSSRDAAGERVFDKEGFDAAVATILAACKEFGKSCGYPANNPEEVEALMAAGWDFFIMQRRNQEAFDAVVTGRRLGGRSIDVS